MTTDDNSLKKRAPGGHKWQTVHNTMIWLIVLNAFFVYTIRNPQSSVDKFAYQISWDLCTALSIPAFKSAQS